jgi:hypothetical protein
MKTKDVKELLSKAGIDSRYVSLRNGKFKLMRGFFYTGGFTSEMLANKVKAAIPTADIIEHHEIWLPFRGGYPTSKQSRWEVVFTIKEQTETNPQKELSL